MGLVTFQAVSTNKKASKVVQQAIKDIETDAFKEYVAQRGDRVVDVERSYDMTAQDNTVVLTLNPQPGRKIAIKQYNQRAGGLVNNIDGWLYFSTSRPHITEGEDFLLVQHTAVPGGWTESVTELIFDNYLVFPRDKPVYLKLHQSTGGGPAVTLRFFVQFQDDWL